MSVAGNPPQKRESYDSGYQSQERLSGQSIPREGQGPSSNFAPVLDIVDEYNWDGENGPSVWDPHLDPSRGRECYPSLFCAFVYQLQQRTL